MIRNRERVVVSIALAVVGILAAGVRTSPAVAGADASLLAWWHTAPDPRWVGLARAVTHLGDAGTLVAISVVTGLVLWMRPPGRPALARAWWIATGSGWAANTALKWLVGRPRPVLVHPLAVESGLGFPSGHAMGTCFVFGLAVVLWEATRGPRAVPWLMTAAAFASGLVGWSRIQLGVHHPFDVLAGWLCGVAWVLVWRPVLREVSGRPSH